MFLLLLLTSAATAAAEVPLPSIGCRTTGQQADDAPANRTALSQIGPSIVRRLSRYRIERGLETLAPRNWACLGLTGSSYVSVLTMPGAAGLERWPIAGVGVIYTRYSGKSSGRDDVAAIIARVMPAHIAFTEKVERDFEMLRFPRGRFPHDQLRYRSASLVQFLTPAHRDGLGTRRWFTKSDLPVEGAAVFDGTDMHVLLVRLPAPDRALTQTIIRSFLNTRR